MKKLKLVGILAAVVLIGLLVQQLTDIAVDYPSGEELDESRVIPNNPLMWI